MRVLIVDDREDNRYLLRMLMQGHGFEVEEAMQAFRALIEEQSRGKRPEDVRIIIK